MFISLIMFDKSEMINFLNYEVHDLEQNKKI